MASPHPSLELSFRSRSLTPVPIDGQPNPSSRAESPAQSIEDTATMRAWRNARDTYRRSLPDKDFKRIMIPAGPEDVLQEIKKWQSIQKKSKYCRVADSVDAGFSRLQMFNRAVDLIAQGTPAPGCLVWGSIIFVLTIVQKAAEEYNKLCNALIRMAECLPSIELYTETFLHSSLVQDCVNAFYSAVLRFWTRACKFYRRHRLWNFVRVVWNDYDAEYKGLEDDMLRCQRRVQESALAEHMGESKAGRTQQQTNFTSLLEAQNSSRQKEIITWLAPTGYAVDYYMEDFESAKAARHANTCQWLLARDAFVHFSQATHSGGSSLWIYAQPGAGKTVLAAFLVDHFAFHQQSGCVLFFFCKDTDDDKRTPIAIARSLLYQLFHALRERSQISALTREISLAMEQSGHKTALDFSTVWNMLSNNISDLTPATIIIDALDECRDPEILIENLRSMASSYNVRVVLTSRKEEHLYQFLREIPSLEVAKDDIDADIKAFVESKVAASPRLSQPSVKTLVINRLCESHEGMFLWVQYMVKELKSCVSLQQVQEELRELPKGLDAVYQRILQRLQDTLDKQTFKLCSKVLTWVTTSLRPLKIDELRQALETHYVNEGHSLLSTDGSFLYSDRDIELVCGSLVTVRNETLQVVHLTVKQYIKSQSGSTTLRLLAETKDANLQLALSCLRFVKYKCAEPIVKLFPKRPIAAEENEHDLSLLRSENPFLEYACFSWLVHLTDCTSTEVLEVSRSFYRTFDSPSTFGWVESCMALQPGSVLRLLLGLEDVRYWIETLQLDGVPAENSTLAFVLNWCKTMEQVFQEHRPAITKRAATIYYLDLALTFAEHGLTDTYGKHGSLRRREKCLRFHSHRIPRPARKEVPPCRQLQTPSGVYGHVVDLFLYESNREIYIYSFWGLRRGRQVLLAQSASSGKKLPPMSEPESRFDEQFLDILSYAMSDDGRYLGIVYKISSREVSLLIAIWEIEVTLDFTRRMQAFPWARVVHRSCIDEPAIPRLWSNPSITFDRNGVCFTPDGLFRTASDAHLFFRDNYLQRLSENGYSDIQCACYSGNGKFLFVSSKAMITKHSFPDLEVHFKLPLSDTKRYTLVASPSGRYLALQAGRQNHTASNLTKTQLETVLIDTLFENTVVLPHSGDPKRTVRDYVLHFSSDEREAIACYSFSTTEYLSKDIVCSIYCYAGLPDGAYIRASGKCIYDLRPLSTRLHVSSDHKSAKFITEPGEVQRIRLGDEVEFLDASDEPSEYPFRSTFLSQDGSRWASVYYGNDKAQIQTHTVLNPDEMPECTELQRTPSPSDDGSTFVTMSMDLSVLVLDGDVYSFRHSKTGVLSTTLQSLKLPKELQTTLPVPSPPCLVDPSNSYVAYHTQKRHSQTVRTGPDVLALFRLNSDETSSPRLQPSLPQDMFNISSKFHPSAPLLIVGFRLISEGGDRESDDNECPFHVVIIDLKEMSKRTVELEINPGLGIDQRYLPRRLPSIELSSSGDFAYITALGGRQIIDHDMEVSPKSHRYIGRILAIDGAFYRLYNSGNGSINLSLSKPEPTRWSVARHTVYLPNLVFLSLSYANRFRAFLILGKTDEDQMHVLLVPDDDFAPELKSVPLTWSEARAILDEKWEKEYGRPLRRSSSD